MGMLRGVALGMGALVGWAWLLPWAALAQDGADNPPEATAPAAEQAPGDTVRSPDAKPRAAVVVLPGERLDAFVPAYLYEVGATVLRGRGYVVAPPSATVEHLVRSGRAEGCLDDADCFQTLARAFSAPSLAVVAPRRTEDDTLVARVVTGIVRDGALTERTDVTVSGDEGEVAERIHQSVGALADLEPPCVVDVQATAGLAPSLDVAGRPPVTTFPAFFDPGILEVTVTAGGRAPWRGQLACTPGGRYRLRVR